MPWYRIFLLAVCAFFWTGSPAEARTVCGGKPIALQTPPLNSNPHATLTLGGRTGPWLIDYGQTRSYVSNSFWQLPDGANSLELDGFTFPGLEGKRAFIVQQGAGSIATLGDHVGTLGTDHLSRVSVELRYDDANDLAIFGSSASCDPPSTFQTGALRIHQPDFFGAPGTKRGSKCAWPESSLPANDASYVTPVCPNVPVVFIELEERTVDPAAAAPSTPKRVGRSWAQIDTGYADTFWPFSVDINEAYLAALRQSGVQPVPVGTIRVSGCGQEDSNRQVLVAPGWKLNVVNERGDRLPGRWFDSFYLVVKPSKTTCGGIGRMAVPAAQLGSSFLRAFGTTLLVPAKSEVWIRTPNP